MSSGLGDLERKQGCSSRKEPPRRVLSPWLGFVGLGSC